VGELLVLWDVDYTLVSADGLGTRLPRWPPGPAR
jgi:hypothetical protein